MADQLNILDSQAEFADRLTSGEGNIPRDALSGSPTMTSGILRLGYRTATKTEPITQVRLWSGGTAAGATPTLVRVGIIMGYAPMMGASLGGQTDLPATSTSQSANVNRPYIIGLP